MQRSLHTPLTLLAATLLASASHAQITTPVPVPTWSKTYGGPVDDQGLHDLRVLPVGRLVAAGYTGSFGGPGHSNWLLDLDLSTGAINTEHISASAFTGPSDGATIARDGGALFLGRDVFDIFVKHDAWLVRVDAAGQVQWTQGFTRPLFGRHFLFDAAELRDGSWVVVGATGLFDFPPQAAWIVRLSATGSVLWHSEYGGGAAETARAVTATRDGGVVVAGWTNSSGAGGDDAWVMKVDAGGAIVWQRTFGGLDTDQAEDIVELEDGGFAVVGSTNSFTSSGHAPWVLRLDGAGALLWHRVVESDVWGDLGGVATTEDGGIVVVGRVAQSGFPSNDLWCAKLTAATGRVLWQNAYEGALGDFGSAVAPVSRPALGPGLVVGGTWGWGFPGEAIWLTRTDSIGSLPCDLVRTTKFALGRPAVTVANGVLSRAPGGATTQDPGSQQGTSSATVIDVCQ